MDFAGKRWSRCIKRAMGWREMSMRGLDKARGEWSLVTMAWNIKRLHVLRAA